MKRFLSIFILGLALSVAHASAKGPLPIQNLALPETLGKIEQRHHDPASKRWIIHIQDVHAHMTAQENISAIVEHVHKLYGVSTVAVEGGWGETTFEETRLDAEAVDKVVDTTGAGDLFAAGFLFGLTRGCDIPTCGRLGGKAAAEIIGQFGARSEKPLAGLLDF